MLSVLNLNSIIVEMSTLKDHSLIMSLSKLSDQVADRRGFHEAAKPLLKSMSEPEFIHAVFESNLNDKWYLQREWSTYEIPFLFIDETDHYYLKYHVFPPVESRDVEKAANIIHHHNNYLLTSLTVQGPGYHTMHFDKQVEELEGDRVKLKLTKDFFHSNMEFSLVDSYEPHIVFNMDKLTTTLVLWSPDKKHITDGLRNNPFIKPFKKWIISLINTLGLNRKVGVADAKVYQWYVENGKAYRILEEDYFGKYKAVKGKETDLFFSQAVALFVQQSGYYNAKFIEEKLHDMSTPDHWKHWLKYLLDQEQIPEVYGKEEINIPSKEIRLNDLRFALS